MSKKIRGITIELGGDASGLEKALTDANKSIYSTQKNLKDVERLLKMDPTNIDLLRQKQEMLGNQISDTTEKLEVLKKAEKEVQEQFEKGEASKEQYDALQREIIATEQSLKGLENKAEATKNAIKDISDRPIEEVADAAKEAAGELKEAVEEASGFSDFLKAGLVVEGAKSIVSGLKDATEESKEYMKIMASLEVSSEKAGYSTKETAAKFKELYGILGDEQSAATTTANLQAIGLSQEKLNEITNATIGAWAKYGDSIPIDGLAEALNETIRVGQVTGTFADVLNWASESEDDFNEKLAKASTEAERADLVMQVMAKQGLADVGKAWKENNKVLIENNEANARVQEQMAELGETVMPVISEVLEIVADLIEKFNGLDKETQKMILGSIALIAVLGPVISTIGTVTSGTSGLSSVFDIVTKTVLPALQTAFTSTFSFIASNPVVLLIAAIVAMVALFATKGEEIEGILDSIDKYLKNVFAKDWTHVFGPVLGEPINSFFATVDGVWSSIKKILNGTIKFINGAFKGDWRKAWEGIQEIFGGIFEGLESLAKAPINGVIGLLNGAIGAINKMISGFNDIGFDMPEWLGGGSWSPDIPLIPKVPYLASGGMLLDGSAVVGEAGPELLTMSGNHAIVQPLTTGNTKDSGFGELIEMLSYYLPNIVENQENQSPVVIEERSFKRGLIDIGVKFK